VTFKSETFVVRFEVFMAVKTEFLILWFVAPRSVGVGYQHFRGLCCFHLQLFITEDGSSGALRNVIIQLLHYTVQQSRQPRILNILSFGLGIFLFTTVSRKALRPTQPPIQWVPRDLSLRVKRPGSEADHSPPSSVEVKE
jgi:hypothetical protein